MIMRKLLTAAVLATCVAAFAGPAYASPTVTLPGIYGTIDVSGGSAGVTTTAAGTTITFDNPANIFSVSGAYDELMTSTSVPQAICSGCITLGTPFSNEGSGLTGSTLPFTLFSGASNGNSVMLSVTSDTFTFLQGGGLEVYGMGWVSLNNYATTLASYSMTIPSTGQSASVDIYTQVPEPGTLVLFAAGLLGCALFVSRRRRSSKSQA